MVSHASGREGVSRSILSASENKKQKGSGVELLAFPPGIYKPGKNIILTLSFQSYGLQEHNSPWTHYRARKYGILIPYNFSSTYDNICQNWEVGTEIFIQIFVVLLNV